MPIKTILFDVKGTFLDWHGHIVAKPAARATRTPPILLNGDKPTVYVASPLTKPYHNITVQTHNSFPNQKSATERTLPWLIYLCSTSLADKTTLHSHGMPFPAREAHPTTHRSIPLFPPWRSVTAFYPLSQGLQAVCYGDAARLVLVFPRRRAGRRFAPGLEVFLSCL